MVPGTSRIDSVSPEHSLVNQKQESKMHFSLIPCTKLLLSSKHLSFLSFQIVHQIHDGVILHLSLFLTPAPASSSQLKRVSAILHSCLALSRLCLWILMKIFHGNKRFTVSAPFHKETSKQRAIFLLIKFSCVKTASLARSQVKVWNKILYKVS